ncbi:hypothetical protein LTR70_009690 [Exophiala xenobiotica]|uniref:Uncharacterized protein n=1 Tax=Lithohypha guttulata TaxID=1690604 RepID=A0ABR0JUU0_9EURO|nr:hypothetical protein LTR24_010142 [Lithohypha guttulata]KAK5310167.1 hypothetical protein LTR70_009690 [Exophiala xenobiotica]
MWTYVGSRYVLAVTTMMAGVHAQNSDKSSCGSLFVAFGYSGGNDIYCYPFIDTDMGRYTAWYNGSTTIILTGNPDECPDETLGPVSNVLGIGGMTVPNNATLDRTTYDDNPF